MTTRKSKANKTVAKTKKAAPAPTKKLSQIEAAIQVLRKSNRLLTLVATLVTCSCY